MKFWEQAEKIKKFAEEQIASAAAPDCIDEWHQFGTLADVHIQTDEEHDSDTVNICVYPLIKDEAGNFTTDTSKGIQLF